MHFHECKCAMTGAHMCVSDERIWLRKFINTHMGALCQRGRDLFSLIDSCLTYWKMYHWLFLSLLGRKALFHTIRANETLFWTNISRRHENIIQIKIDFCTILWQYMKINVLLHLVVVIFCMETACLSWLVRTYICFWGLSGNAFAYVE